MYSHWGGSEHGEGRTRARNKDGDRVLHFSKIAAVRISHSAVLSAGFSCPALVSKNLQPAARLAQIRATSWIGKDEEIEDQGVGRVANLSRTIRPREKVLFE